MYKTLIIILSLLPAATMAQQTDTAGIVVYKDARIDQLIHKQMEINEETTRDSRRSMPGFRIQVISSTDRNKVFAAKTKVYQQFPDLKPYVLYQPPYYKLRVGNFKTQTEAEEFEKQLSTLFPSGLYVIRDTIEVTPERLKEEGPQ
jgi:stalled ribosome rescue protein Dom34